jgi:ribulose-5-phosphate 4-epimerase/fuculose-1-phosphate aldolase
MSVTSLRGDQRSSMSSEEWAARVDLAACYRLLAHYRMTDLIYTHSTMRVPGEPGKFLINPYGARWDEITASSLVKIDVDGNKVDDSPARVNPAGFTIHSAVHMARHDAACVIHTHTRAGMAVSVLNEGLLPLSQIALQFYGRLGLHDYEGIALDLDERGRIIRDLGHHCGLILRNHGLLTVGRSVAEAFSLMFYLNLACEVQVSTLSMGRELVIPPQEVCERVGRQYDQMAFDDGDLQLEWAAHLRMLDALDPSYRT